LNRYPELKAWLKEGQAESYQNVEVEYVAGRTAVLTIYRGGIEQEQVILHTLATQEDMHQMMQRKGFVRRETASPERLMFEQDRNDTNTKVNLRQAQLLQRRQQTKEDYHRSQGPQYARFVQILVGCASLAVLLVHRRQRLRRYRAV
jgi:hypothetical protein